MRLLIISGFVFRSASCYSWEIQFIPYIPIHRSMQNNFYVCSATLIFDGVISNGNLVFATPRILFNGLSAIDMNRV